MVAVIFRFDLKVRSKKAKKGQKMSIFKIQNFENKTHLLIQFHLRNPTVQFVFVYDVYKWPKNVI